MPTYADGVYQFGGVPCGGGLLPPMGGSGRAYFVDPANGAAGNTADKPSDALDSVGQAEALCTDKAGDTVYLLNDGNTTGTSRESTIPLVWDKDNTHCIGLCAPTMISQRARITPASGATIEAEPMITVSGHGNIFKNLQIAHWGNTDGIAARGVDVSGNRNYFENCHIVGIGGANVGDEATACDVKLTGEENTFVNCVFGADTVARSDANACIELTSAATRNIFKNCIFQVFADAAGALFVKIDGSGDIDRYVLFDNCIFYNAVGSTATTMTAAMDVHASAGGLVIVKDCMLVGADDWEAADSSNIKLLCNTIEAAAGQKAMGIAVDVDVA